MSGRARFLSEVDVSRETLERLDLYAALLAKWNPSINLVAKSTLGELWTRHFLDSAQILNLADPNLHHWVDLGTGGGFPGLIVAILAAQKRPDLKMTCVESDMRKATFLRTVCRETGITCDVISKRIEDIAPLEADIISARALASLDKLLVFSHQHLKPEGKAIFLKGAGYREEVDEARKHWGFSMQAVPSKTDNKATILTLGDLQRV
ncbi:MAG: 16S rRNA (guanine(527)-N(7))-methyltransferase RsmG [Maritimibacter sp.]